MEWLITYEQYRNDRAGTKARRTELTSCDPREFWLRKLDDSEWDGCVILFACQFAD